MASDVLITPASGLIQFSSSAGSGSGQIKVDGDDLVVSNVLGDVLLGDGASDVFIGNGTDNVDIVFEQNGEIRDDTSGKSITLGSKTTNILISGSNTIAMQKGGGNVGIGKTAATTTLEVVGDISASGDSHRFGDLSTNGATIEVRGDSSGADLTKLGKIDLYGQGDQRLHLRSMGDGGFSANKTNKAALVASQYDLGIAYNWHEGGASAQNSELRIYNSESIAITVTSQSRVGIGTGATVGEALEVVGNISASGELSANTVVVGSTITHIGDTNTLISFGTDTLTFKAGNEAFITITEDGSQDNIVIGDGGDIDFHVKAGGNNTLFAQGSSQNIGIGTATPGEKLEVIGNISASGNITAVSMSGDGSGLTGVSATLPGGVVSSSAQIADVTLTTAAQTNITSLGTLTTLTVDDITINGSTISDGGDFSLDVEGDITFDANGADIILSDNGTDFGRFKRDNSNFIIKSEANNNDIIFRGQDGGTTITALTLDMSEAGKAIFTGDISSSGNIIGELTGIGGAVTGITSLLATDIKIGEDDETKIDFETANEIHFYANNVEQVYLADNIFGPQSDSDVDLGASGVRWKDSYFDTVTTRNLTTTGPTTIGDGNDVIQFNPRILVEGDISASGDLHLTDITASGEIKADHFLATDQDDGYHFGDSSVALQRANNALEVKYSSTVAQFSNTIGLNLTGHITASGNISASGTIQSTGNISTDGAINATSADFGDGNISSVGVIDLDTIRGDGDTNTNIAFGGDKITFTAGNEALLTLTEGETATGRDVVIVGDGGDVDFQVKTSGDDNAIYAQGSSDNVGIGTSTPGQKLEVIGNISGSGEIFAKVGQHRFEKTSNTDADAKGDVVFLGGTTSMTAGKIYHYKSDGTWELADADAVATSDGLLAVALGAASDVNGMLLRGTVTLDHDPGAVGDVLFLSTTAGQATATAPSGNTDIVRVIGYCLDASNGQIFFNPDSAFVEVSA